MKKDITAGEGCRGVVGGGREDRQRPWRRSLQQHPCTIQQFLACPPDQVGSRLPSATSAPSRVASRPSGNATWATGA
jgi:hypothetical protein